MLRTAVSDNREGHALRIGQRRHYLSGYPAIILGIGPDGIPEGGVLHFLLDFHPANLFKNVFI